MSRDDYRRWTELMDAETAGEPIDPEDRAFCDELEGSDEAAALEVELIAQLTEEREGAPDQAAHRIVAAAIAEAKAAREAPGWRRAAWAQRRRVSGWALGAAAVAAATLTAVVWPTDDAPSARAPAFRAEVVYASGDVRIGGAPHRVGAGVLQPGVVVETGGGGHACLVVDPGIDLCAGEHTQLKVVEASEVERRVELITGRVSASLDPQPPGSRFSIHAAGVVSTAVGTVFSVALPNDGGEVETLVSEGQVAVAARGGEQRVVRAHERALSASRVRVEGVTRMDEARSSAGLGVARLWREGLPATLEVRAHERVAVALDGEPVGDTPLLTLVPAGVHEVAVLEDGMPARGQRVRLEAGGRLRVELEADAPEAVVIDPETGHTDVIEPPGDAARRDPSLEALLRQARSQMLDHRWAAAARSYQVLRRRHTGDPEAHAVLVSLGELQLTHLGKPAAGLSAFDAYLKRGGPLAQEAAHGRIRALRALQRRGAEARAISAFLERYPDSPHRGALEARRLELDGTP